MGPGAAAGERRAARRGAATGGLRRRMRSRATLLLEARMFGPRLGRGASSGSDTSRVAPTACRAHREPARNAPLRPQARSARREGAARRREVAARTNVSCETSARTPCSARDRTSCGIPRTSPMRGFHPHVANPALLRPRAFPIGSVFPGRPSPRRLVPLTVPQIPQHVGEYCTKTERAGRLDRGLCAEQESQDECFTWSIAAPYPSSLGAGRRRKPGRFAPAPALPPAR